MKTLENCPNYLSLSFLIDPWYQSWFANSKVSLLTPKSGLCPPYIKMLSRLRLMCLWLIAVLGWEGCWKCLWTQEEVELRWVSFDVFQKAGDGGWGAGPKHAICWPSLQCSHVTFHGKMDGKSNADSERYLDSLSFYLYYFYSMYMIWIN